MLAADCDDPTLALVVSSVRLSRCDQRIWVRMEIMGLTTIGTNGDFPTCSYSAVP
eukprot:COSAG01_NODE_4081_length_5376_cov_7.484556_8_plen_55_part_00